MAKKKMRKGSSKGKHMMPGGHMMSDAQMGKMMSKDMPYTTPQGRAKRKR